MNKIVLIILLTATSLLPFGKNKVQYHDFDWKYFETEHFRIYYYEGGRMLAEFCGENAENSLTYLQRDFMYRPKSKIHIIVYNSHNHFEETNVMGGIPEESVGGFTEFFKNRMVVPYEGDWEGFRHVIHHELTHALMNQLLFRGSYQSIVSGLSRMNMPLWFIEGIAEYESRGGWDAESDQAIRDAVYNDYIGNVYYLNNYLAYKGGQSLFKYISDTYGSRKIGELLRGINVIKSVEDAFLDAIGTNFEDLSENWSKWLKTRYWSTLIQTEIPEETAVRLSDHVEYGNSINNSPSVSPDGKKIAFLSNKSDYFDIYLMRTFDGKIVNKIVSGQSSGDFEEFHWLRPGITWSPDSRRIAFFSKSSEQDALFIYDAISGDQLKKMKFGLDGLYYPDWSSDGNYICFTGIKNGYSDIYVYDIISDDLQKYTDDIYSDINPKFSPDGKKIIFASDRHGDLSINNRSLDSILDRDLDVKDIYILDIESDTLSEVTASKSSEESSPFWITDSLIAFVSDRTGIGNIYIKETESDSIRAVTNLMTGCSQTSFNDGKIAFTAVFNGGYDIYLIEDTDELLKKEKEPPNVIWYEERDMSKPLNEPDSSYTFSKTDLRKFKFTREVLDRTAQEVLRKTESDETGVEKDYKLRFTPDIITVNAGYATGYGVVGSAYLQFSDYLSDHSFILITDLNQDLLNSNLGLYYYYLKKRMNIGFGISHDVVYYYVWNQDDLYIENEYRDRLLSFHIISQYPFSRYTRIDSRLNIRSVINEVWHNGKEKYFHNRTKNLYSVGAGFSYDNVIWGYMGPENGTRIRFDADYSAGLSSLSGDTEEEFTSFMIDARKYFRISGDYQFALRLSGGLSEGVTPRKFFVGGLSNWINSDYNRDQEFETVVDKYYSSRKYPLRGFMLLERSGNRFALANAEFRYPFIKYLLLGFPLPTALGNISGALFTDFGSAWNDNDFRGTVKTDTGRKLNDFLFSGGIGTRMSVGYFILRYDIAWPWDMHSDPPKPYHILSLGTNF